jgi:hypothetical protein
MNNHNNRILLLIFISITVYFSSQAQTQSSDSTFLKEGIWALQFGIAGNFTLTSFQGSTIGAKYQLSDKNAIRGGITISGSANDGTTSNSGSIDDTSYGAALGSSSTKSATVSFVLQYLWYMNPNGPVHFYTALGPLVSYIYSKNSADNPSLSTVYNSGSYQEYWGQQLSTSNSTQWGVGGAGTVGVEWFACRWLSLHADYNESIQYRWSSNSSSQDNSSTYPKFIPSHTNNSGKSKGWTLSSSGVAFGLNIYL